MNCLQNEKGFSLLEVVIAVTIFAIGLLAVASMQTTSVKGNADSQFLSEATSLGQGHIEFLLSLPYGHDDLDTGVAHTRTDGNFTYNWTVTEDDLFSSIKTIQLDVIYTARGLSKQSRIIAAKADVI